ncbi:MAG: HAMP domain-containing histidine kinase [Clostridia bacterium]|nr:HAMP domain-containing histidine kinase [Clostridia bacterium]
MILKNRLVISNATVFILPVLITIAAASVYIFVSSNLLDIKIGYGSVKHLAERRYELFKADSLLVQRKCDMLTEKDFQQFLASRLTGAGADIVTLKEGKIVFSTREFSKIDIEKCLSLVKSGLFSDSIDLNGISYIIKIVPLAFEDGNQGSAIFLAELKKEGIAFDNLLVFTVIVFLTSFVITNILLSLMLSKSISKPLKKLKTAAGEISCGNLNYEIIEDGDEEIRDLCKSFEQMRLKLKESVHTQMKYDDNRKMLVSSISHDLKTPITSIKGYVNGIIDGVANTPEKIEKYLKTIYSKASQVDSMIDDLLLYSRLDLSQIPFNFEETDISRFFRDCVLECGPELEKANINLIFESKVTPAAYVLIDREKVRRVIDNVIDNARKYMNRTDGEIRIILRESSSNIIIEIRDNGPGINKEHLIHIFDRFYRTDSSRSKIKGSGLGLAIAKQIIEGHNGRIWATSQEKEGTSIMISLKNISKGRLRHLYEKSIDC